MTQDSWAKIISEYIADVLSIHSTLPGLLDRLENDTAEANRELEAFLATFAEEEVSADYPVPLAKHGEYISLTQQYHAAKSGCEKLPSFFLIALLSRYDAFVGSLVRHLINSRPEILKGSHSTIKSSLLSDFESIDDVHDYLGELQKDRVLRRSYYDQFQWFGGVVKIGDKLPLLPTLDFLESTERRHLLVHCGGKVNKQYVESCTARGIDVSGIKLGDRLEVDQTYFKQATYVYYEVGVKLAHLIWRRIERRKLSGSDQALSKSCYDLLVLGQYRLAKRMLDFACLNLEEYSTEKERRVFIINRAQTYKWLGDEDGCRAILNAEDWSSTDVVFRANQAVLKDEHSQARSLLLEAVKSGQIKKANLQQWPVYRKVRAETWFNEIFQSFSDA